MKTSVDKAIAVIRGYCNKLASCETCRYRLPNELCPFSRGVPCDWAMDKGSEVEKGEQEE